jgi:DNA-binding FadR family transcriptional regulator
MPVVNHVAKVSVTDHLVGELKEAILTGALGAGSYLPAERELAATAGVNRQAVREALQQLRQLGLVEISQGDGVKVLDWRDGAHFSVLYDSLFAPDGSVRLADAGSILRMRMVAMADAARLAARARTPEQLALMDRLVSEMEAEPADAPVTPRFDIWDIIVEASGNLAYRLTFNSQMEVVRRLPVDVLLVLSAGARMVPEYRQLVQAIDRRDADRAADATRAILGAIVITLDGRL